MLESVNKYENRNFIQIFYLQDDMSVYVKFTYVCGSFICIHKEDPFYPTFE